MTSDLSQLGFLFFVSALVTFVGRWFFGDTSTFHVPPLQAMAVDSNAFIVLILIAVLGALSGVAAAGFIKGLHQAEDLFDGIKSRYCATSWVCWSWACLCTLLLTFGQYYVDGVGYATVQAVLAGQVSSFWLLARTGDSEGASCQHVSRPLCARSDGR